MKSRLIPDTARIPVLIALAMGLSVSCAFADAESQANALLARMTLDEKIGQMVQPDSLALQSPDDVKKYFLGSVLSGGNSDPANNLPATWLKMVEGLEAAALDTRLHIPLLYGIDAVHGHSNINGATIFPHNIGLGATHDPALAEQAAVAARMKPMRAAVRISNSCSGSG